MKKLRATTVVCVKKNNETAIAGDGQVTLGATVMKGNAVKVRTLYGGKVLSGFAGAVADALTLFDRIEQKLEQYDGDLLRSCAELAKDWRMDKYLRRLEAMLIVASKDTVLLLSGTGEVIEPEGPVVAIGSGGDYARSAALALIGNTKLSAKEIARKSLEVAGQICIYTNDHITIEGFDGKSK